MSNILNAARGLVSHLPFANLAQPVENETPEDAAWRGARLGAGIALSIGAVLFAAQVVISVVTAFVSAVVIKVLVGGLIGGALGYAHHMYTHQRERFGEPLDALWSAIAGEGADLSTRDVQVVTQPAPSIAPQPTPDQ